jgi:hypothetical protein
MRTKVTYHLIDDMSVLKVGDIVYIDTTYNLRPFETAQVIRFTGTMIICANKWGTTLRFRQKDGVEVGHDIWHSPKIIGLVIKEEPIRESK